MRVHLLLPLFFVCLLLHQRRVALDDEHTLPAPTDEVLDRLLVNESIERVKERGRELCIHEHVVSGGGSSSDAAACPLPSTVRTRVSGGGGGAVHGASPERCPVVVAETVVARQAQVAAQPVPGTAA